MLTLMLDEVSADESESEVEFTLTLMFGANEVLDKSVVLLAV